MCVKHSVGRQTFQSAYLIILFLVVQGFSPTATPMHSSDTSYNEADYLSRNTIVVVALPIVGILLSSMRLSFANDHITYNKYGKAAKYLSLSFSVKVSV